MSTGYIRSKWPLQQHPLVIATGVIVIFGAISMLWKVRDVFLLGFVSIIFAVLMDFPVSWLSRFLKRGFATVLVLLALMGLIGGFFVVAAAPFAGEFRELAEQVPAATRRIDQWITRIQEQSRKGRLPVTGEQVRSRIRARVSDTVEALIAKAPPAAITVGEVVTGIFVVLIMAAFLVHQPGSYLRATRVLVPREYDGIFIQSLMGMGDELRAWLGGIIIAMALMGGFTAFGLAVAGIQGWWVLALLTFFGTFVPYMGAIASAIPGLITALAQSPTHFAYALLVYLGVHIMEGYIVQPLIMKRAVEIRPAILLFGQVIMGAIFGTLGVVIATPVLVCLKVLTARLYVERELGKDVKVKVA